MSSSIGHRIQELIEHSGKSVNQFAAQFGDRPDKYYNIIKGKTNPSWEMIESIVKAYPEVDGNWLLRGEGAMLLLSKSNPVPYPGVETSSPATEEIEKEQSREELLLKMITDKEKIIALLEKQLSLLEQSWQAK